MQLARTHVGDGPRRTILLHGFLGSGRNLSTLARAWAKADPQRSFELLDLTGHGASPALPKGADVFTMARDVLLTASEAGLSAPYEIFGHSLGGRVALATLLEAPESVRSVTLLDIHPGPLHVGPSLSQKTLQALLVAPERAESRDVMRAHFRDAGLPPAIVEWVLMNLQHTERGYEWRIDAESLAEASPRVNAADLWPAVEPLKRPVLCVRGGKSNYVNDAEVARMEAAGVEVVTIPDAGHFVHVDALEELVRVLAGR